MSGNLGILVLGASYGSLLGLKAALAGHRVTLVCLPAEADLINAEGAIVRMPVKGREGLLDINSRNAPGMLDAKTPGDVDLAAYDLVAFAMQEPQYGSSGVRELLAEIGRARKPSMSIMNMPPLPYLKRIAGMNVAGLTQCFTDPSVWSTFEPGKLTLCSPDPQASRPPGEKVNVLQVRLPTNFKAASFEDDADTELLRRLQRDIEAIRYDIGGEQVELPVKLKVHESIYVPMAKWAMLLAGNYRCVGRDGMRSIRDAVHTDLAATQGVYDWVVDLCVELGADRADMVPFEKYAAAAHSLESPSSAARALAAGAQNIERVDALVRAIGMQKGQRNAAIDEVVTTVDGWLSLNRRKTA